MRNTARLFIAIVLLVGASTFASAEIMHQVGQVTFAGAGVSQTFDIARLGLANTLNSVTVRFWDMAQATLRGGALTAAPVTITGDIHRGYTWSGVTSSGFAPISNQYNLFGAEL